jgi:hypothetical protein
LFSNYFCNKICTLILKINKTMNIINRTALETSHHSAGGVLFSKLFAYQTRVLGEKVIPLYFNTNPFYGLQHPSALICLAFSVSAYALEKFFQSNVQRTLKLAAGATVTALSAYVITVIPFSSIIMTVIPYFFSKLCLSVFYDFRKAALHKKSKKIKRMMQHNIDDLKRHASKLESALSAGKERIDYIRRLQLQARTELLKRGAKLPPVEYPLAHYDIDSTLHDSTEQERELLDVLKIKNIQRRINALGRLFDKKQGEQSEQETYLGVTLEEIEQLTQETEAMLKKIQKLPAATTSLYT